jgi:hypothetical protein
MELKNAEQYFATARERYKIKLVRDGGLTRKGWTLDPIFQTWRFCNVHREDDKTTIWLRQNVTKSFEKINRELREGNFATFLSRSELLAKHTRELIKAVVIFRWFNRIETGEKILHLLLYGWDSRVARAILKNVSPVVTGAYIIKGPDGMSKLDGVLHCIDRAIPKLQECAYRWRSDTPLEEAWLDLKEIYYLGGFMSYEIVSDLRWTPVLDRAPDINTWANAGPGCARGIGWVVGYHDFNSNFPKDQTTLLGVMRQLLDLSKNPDYWPSDWRPWEMREVEHWACEFDKYKRAESGQKLKRRYQ